MKVISFNETEKSIIKDVIQDVNPDDRLKEIYEFLEGNLGNPNLKESLEGMLIYNTLDSLHEKIISSDQNQLLKFLQEDPGELENIFDDYE